MRNTASFHRWLGLLVCTLMCVVVNGQSDSSFVPTVPKPEKEWKLKDHLVTGGTLGAAFGTTTFVQIAPQVGVRLKDNTSVGVGVNYMYFKSPGFSGQSLYGWNVWGRQFVLDNVFIMMEYEQLNRQVYDPRSGFSRRNVPMLFVGGGVYTGQRQGFGMSLQVMYDLIGDPYSPYTNPLIRIGGALGF